MDEDIKKEIDALSMRITAQNFTISKLVERINEISEQLISRGGDDESKGANIQKI